MASDMVRKTIMVKRDAGTSTTGKKRRRIALGVGAALKTGLRATAMALPGGVATGLALALVGRVSFLRDAASKGGVARALVVTGTSMGIASLGLLAYGRMGGGKRAAGIAPYVLAGAALTSLAPQIASELVDRVTGVVSGLLGSPGGLYARRVDGVNVGGTLPRSTPGGALGPRRSLLAATPGGVSPADVDGVATGGTLRRF